MREVAMHIKLLIHCEATDVEEPPFVWWAESPDVAEFSAAADHLPDLLVQARVGLEEYLGTDVTIDVSLAEDDPPPQPTVSSNYEAEGEVPRNMADEAQARSRSAMALTPAGI
jgi:hypothetical protein